MLNCKLCTNKAEIHDYCFNCWNSIAKYEVIAAFKLMREKIGYKNNVFNSFFKLKLRKLIC